VVGVNLDLEGMIMECRVPFVDHYALEPCVLLDHCPAEVGEVKVVDRIAVRKFVVEVHKFVEMCPAVVAVRRQELAQKQDFVHILVEMIPLL